MAIKVLYEQIMCKMEADTVPIVTTIVRQYDQNITKQGLSENYYRQEAY